MPNPAIRPSGHPAYTGYEAPPSTPAYTGYEAPASFPAAGLLTAARLPTAAGLPAAVRLHRTGLWPAGVRASRATPTRRPSGTAVRRLVPPPPQPYGTPGGYGYPATPPGTNTMAIASLVASVVGVLCGIGSVVGIVLGVVALNQIKQTRQAGYGLAVAGIVVGIATLIISMIWAIYAWR